MRTRICLRCGFDGPEIQQPVKPEAFICPCCGEDLYARPARSYAELEGFTRAPAVQRRLEDPEPLSAVADRIPRWKRGLLMLRGIAASGLRLLRVRRGERSLLAHRSSG